LVRGNRDPRCRAKCCVLAGDERNARVLSVSAPHERKLLPASALLVVVSRGPQMRSVPYRL
jgi:hypothetical protein